MRLLEREGQLGQLSDALARAHEGHGSVVNVHGDAGIGKTSLLRHFVEAHADAADVRWGACDDLLTPHPFGPFWDIADGDAELRAALAANDRPRVFRLLLGLLAGAERPAVVVVEDAHWIDEASLDLLTHVGRRISDRRGVLIVTCRDVAMQRGNQLARVLGDLPNDVKVRVTIPPLTAAGVTELARAFGQPDTQRLEQSGGNPLFVTELLQNPGVAVPSSVRELTLTRLSAIGPAERQLLSLISVVPGRMEHALVEACVGPTPDGLDDCEAHGLIETSPTALTFRHEVVRRAVEVSLSTTERTRCNQTVLNALIASGAEATRIVHHARWARDTDAVVHYAPVAAANAAALDCHREAVEHFRLLDPLVDGLPPGERARILVAWAREEITLGHATHGARCAERGVTALREGGDVRALSRGLVQLGYARWFDRDQPAAEAAAAEAVTILEELGHPTRDLARAQSECAGLAMSIHNVDEAIELADRALASAERVGDRATHAHALSSKGAAISTRDYQVGCELMEASLAIAQQEGFGYHSIRACLHLADVALDHCDLARADRYITAGSAIAVDRERDSFREDFSVLSTHLLLLAGRVDEAQMRLEAAIALEDRFYAPTLHRLHGALLSMRGAEGADATLGVAREEAERTGDPRHELLVAVARAEHAWLRGGSADVDAETPDALQRAVSFGQPWIAGALGLWLWKSGGVTGAPAVCAAPYRLQIEGRWRESAEMWERLGLPYLRAIALADGDSEAKLAALRTLDRLGAVPLARRVRRELRAAGVRGIPRQPRPSTLAGGGLTARQLEVLRLVRDGSSNKEIAERLFISARTAEHHLSAILTALPATSRADAVAIAEQRGLLGERTSGSDLSPSQLRPGRSTDPIQNEAPGAGLWVWSAP